MNFISQIFDFRIISESLNSQTSTPAVYKAYCNSLFLRVCQVVFLWVLPFTDWPISYELNNLERDVKLNKKKK